jgi:cell division protein FtsZ
MKEIIENMIVPEGWNAKDSIIKIIGVGGGGTNAVNQMYLQGIKDVNFLVCNTDSKHLNQSPVPEKLFIGEGLGAGTRPQVARDAAIAKIDEIKKSLEDGTKMIFITAGMGGGTGTGASPIIAKIAKELGILTIAVVTQPFLDEGLGFIRRAYEGIIELSKYVDSLLIIDNQKLYEIYGSLPINEALQKANDVLNTAVKGIAEIITGDGFMNVDFSDVKMALENSGMALMGVGEASGKNRALEAVEKAFSSPLLRNYNLKTADSVLINITSNKKKMLETREMEDIVKYVIEYTGNAEKFKKGLAFDDSLEEETVRVTVVAAGISAEITPPPPPKKKNNPGGINIDSEDPGMGIDVPIGEGYKIISIDIKDIPIYKQGINIADFENETALKRREMIEKEKK